MLIRGSKKLPPARLPKATRGAAPKQARFTDQLKANQERVKALSRKLSGGKPESK